MNNTYTISGTLNLSKEDDKSFRILMRESDQSYRKFRKQVADSACTGIFDGRFHRLMVTLIVDLYYGMISVEYADIQAEKLYSEYNIKQGEFKYTFLCTRNQDACAVHISIA